jgi:hypothetical protein
LPHVSGLTPQATHASMGPWPFGHGIFLRLLA